ncbi:MAG: hypothetical protein WDM76_01555 [Limisphaerales bacterium]
MIESNCKTRRRLVLERVSWNIAKFQERQLHKFSMVVGVMLAIVLLFSPVGARADYTTTINPQTTWGVWEGWGTSLCWWANVFG